jgi:ParB-like chromosome segregation protein Spo0J
VSLTVEWVPIGKVFLNPGNPRVNDPGVPHLVASIRPFGGQQPIVAKRSGEVIARNTRLKAAQSLGLIEVPVVWFEGSELDATAYAIADNKTHEFATWDEPALAKVLELLRAEDSLEGIGYSSDDIDELLAKLDAELPPNEVDERDAAVHALGRAERRRRRRSAARLEAAQRATRSSSCATRA